MALGELLTAVAHEVSPRQERGFEGGFVDNLVDLGTALNEKSLSDALQKSTPLNFDFPDEESRTHTVRDALMTIAFGTGPQQSAAAVGLCHRLAGKMDGRNKNCLLLVSVHQKGVGTARETALWMFPHDRVIQRKGGKVDLNDAFSLSSGLRKAASFSGDNNRSGFLSGMALDHQSSSADQKVAQFWINRFLEGSLQIQSREGTNLLASAFREANKSLADDEASQSQLVASIHHVRAHAGSRPWTLSEVSHSMPPGAARSAFDKATGDGPQIRAPFSIDLEAFDQKIKFRVFKLDNGITVSTPFMEVGGAVTIEASDGGSRLTATGLIKGEGIRATQ